MSLSLKVSVEQMQFNTGGELGRALFGLADPALEHVETKPVCLCRLNHCAATVL